VRGAATEQPLVSAQGLSYDDAVVGNLELAKLVAMGAPTHFDNGQYAFQTALDFYIALHDDCVGKESGAIWAES
jgi:hypothetical protein